MAPTTKRRYGRSHPTAPPNLVPGAADAGGDYYGVDGVAVGADRVVLLVGVWRSDTQSQEMRSWVGSHRQPG